MERSIVAFRRDTEGDWVAELDCGHRQHVRHDPPFRTRPWVLDDQQRAAHLGTPLDCPLCERGEMPDAVRSVRRSPEWTASSLPAGLRRTHTLAAGTWGRLVVLGGRLRFQANTTPPIDRVLEPGEVQAIAPGVEHHVEPDADARCLVEFLEVLPWPERRPAPGERPTDEATEG